MLKDDRARTEEIKGSNVLGKISGEIVTQTSNTSSSHRPTDLAFCNYTLLTNVDLQALKLVHDRPNLRLREKMK